MKQKTGQVMTGFREKIEMCEQTGWWRCSSCCNAMGG
jgi:hypothetical protein